MTGEIMVDRGDRVDLQFIAIKTSQTSPMIRSVAQLKPSQ